MSNRKPFADAPFSLGQTYRGKDHNGNLINDEWLGRVFWFDRYSITAGRKKVLTGRPVGAVVLRNITGGALLGKRLCRTVPTADTYGTSFHDAVIGSGADQRYAYAVDPYLPAAGVADDDLFFGIFFGPTILLSPQAEAAYGGANIAVGDLLGVSADANGRPKKTATIASVIGTALTAATAASDASKELLVDMHCPWAP